MCTRLSVHMLQMHMCGVFRRWVETDARGRLPELGRSAGARSSTARLSSATCGLRWSGPQRHGLQCQ